MSLETIYLIEATASNGTVYRFCTGTGYTSLPTDVPANAYYQPRVEQPGLFRQNMYAVGTTSGASSGGYGEITLINTDGGLDALIDLGFDGQLCVVKEGKPGAALATFATIITGTIEQCEMSWSLVTFRLKDKTALLNTSAQTVLYLGNNVLPAGREGGEDLKDKPKPRLFGVCNNITPICVNTSKLIYQVNSGPVFDIPAVHDGGSVGQIIKGADYATGDLLEAAAQPAVTNPATPPGSYTTCLAEGLFRLDSAPFMQLTCDVIQGTTQLTDAGDRTPARIIRTLATEKLGAAYVAAQPLIDLDQDAHYIVGYYTGANDITTSAILDALCPSAGAWWGFDNLGIFWAKQLTEPDASQAIMTLTQADILSIERTATADGDKGVPVYRVNVDFSKNWTVQTSGLAGSVSGNQLTFEPDNAAQLTTDRKNLLAMEYLRTKKQDVSVKTTHLLAPEITIKTTMDSPAAANSEADRVLAMRKVRRDRLEIKVPLQAIQYPAGGYWDDEAISDIPVELTGHTCEVFGNYLFVIGGQDTDGLGVTTIYRLDLSNPTSSWDLIKTMPYPFQYHSTTVYEGQLYVIGGTNFGQAVISIDLATIATASWVDAGISDLPATRSDHKSVAYNNYLYVIGGVTSSGATAGVIRLNLADPTGVWDDAGVTDLPTPLADFSVVTHAGKVFVIGGMGFTGSPVSEIYYLDLAAPSGPWITSPASLPQVTFGMAVAQINNLVYIMGGTGSVETASTMTFNVVTHEIDDIGVSDLPAARTLAAAAAYNGSVYLIGGYSGAVQGNTWRLRTNNNPDDAAHRTSLGRTVLVKYPRYGYTAGRPMKTIGTELDLKSRIITLELWG